MQDNDTYHRQTMLQLSGRVKQLEQLMQLHFVSKSSAPDLAGLKALTDKLGGLERQVLEGLQENHMVHKHNAQVCGVGRCTKALCGAVR